MLASNDQLGSGNSKIWFSVCHTGAWHDAIGDPTYADAILDRLIHNAYRIELRGDSMRRRKPALPGDKKNK
jgi:DNA replication protein DnaC